MFSLSPLTFVIASFFLPWTLGVSETLYTNPLDRSKRDILLWPNSTVLQFNVGIGAPSPEKNINFNFAFQANFQLPWNRTQIPTDILVANSGYDGSTRKKREANEMRETGGYENDARLYHFYKYVEEVLNGFGYHGESCVRRVLCQLAAEPLHSEDEEDLLHELASFVLNPTNDVIDHPSHRRESRPYIDAYTRGQKSQNCSKLYHKCSMSLIDIFTKLHEVS